MGRIDFLLLALLGLGLAGCDVFDEDSEINSNIVEVRQCCPQHDLFDRGYYAYVSWSRDGLFAMNPLRRLVLDESFRVVEDNSLTSPSRGFYAHAAESGESVLYVRSNWADGSAGALHEFDTAAGTSRLLVDSTRNVSSAVYLPAGPLGGAGRLVYYAYGHYSQTGGDPEQVPGYYLLDPATGRDSLVLRHTTPLGPSETVNGFDLSPDGRTLLFPISRERQREGFVERLPPIIGRYDLAGGAAARVDTLGVAFDPSEQRVNGLWLRYSPNGDRVLYVHFPYGAWRAAGAANDVSEVGVLDAQTWQKRVLDVNTEAGGHSVQLTADWSPDGRHIAYSSAVVDLPGSGVSGAYSVYVLKDVN
ncbi:MAG: hypothetical protein AAGI91_01020 [Bacteroidota bacterium]